MSSDAADSQVSSASNVMETGAARDAGGFWHCGTADAHRDVLRIPRARFKIGFMLMSSLFRIGWLSFGGGECMTCGQNVCPAGLEQLSALAEDGRPRAADLSATRNCRGKCGEGRPGVGGGVY